jgi:hypothetical protein
MGGGLVDSLRRGKADRVVVDALRKLTSMNLSPTDGTTSAAFLPKLALEYQLAEGLTKRELADGMRRLMTDGRLKREKVGTYSNRSPRFGLVEA